MDIYAEVTARIITEMEKGMIPWEKPWIACGGAISHATGKRYSLLNQMLLGRAGEIACAQGASAQATRAGEYVKVCVTFAGETAQICLA